MSSLPLSPVTADLTALELWTTGGILALLLLLSAFFSGSETALTGASRARIHTLAKDNNRAAKLIIKLRAHSESLIGTILLFNTLLNILASALATSLFLHIFGETG
ncbi:MAG: CNNM domain-containing protein, partial [Dongiaceae bacterium]